MGHGSEAGWAALKAALLYATAVTAFRVGKRRTLAEMSPFDFVAAVAAGAVVGRVATAPGTPFLVGAVALVTLLLAHFAVTELRRIPVVARVLDRQPRVLVVYGNVRERELRRCGLTRSDLHSLLRQHGLGDVEQARFVIFEHRGRISVIRRGDGSGDDDLVREVVAREATTP